MTGDVVYILGSCSRTVLGMKKYEFSKAQDVDFPMRLLFVLLSHQIYVSLICIWCC